MNIVPKKLENKDKGRYSVCLKRRTKNCEILQWTQWTQLYPQTFSTKHIIETNSKWRKTTTKTSRWRENEIRNLIHHSPFPGYYFPSYLLLSVILSKRPPISLCVYTVSLVVPTMAQTKAKMKETKLRLMSHLRENRVWKFVKYIHIFS